MNISKITLTDVMGSKHIDVNTPVIVLYRVPIAFLILINMQENIYDVNTDKLHNSLEKKIQFIHRFLPIGQLQPINKTKKYFNIILANTHIIPTATSFELIDRCEWAGYIKKNDNVSRSIGTIHGTTKPNIYIPVFPSSFLKKVDDNDGIDPNYVDVHSSHKYGRWILIKYKFNIDKTHLRMIDSTGDIGNMFLPIYPKDIMQLDLDNDDNYNRKIYFTVQGTIASDTNCIPTGENSNMGKPTLNECNGSYLQPQPHPQPQANDDNTMSNDISPYHEKTKRSKWFKRGKTIVLKENNEPWFLDASIVGTALHTTDPHKVTGTINTLGTIYGNDDEINMPFKSDCKTDEHIIGYSRYDKKQKCREGFDNKKFNYNNIIIYVMCITIILLLVFRSIKASK